MFIRNLQIQNYKSFSNSVEIPFERGFNLVVGQNDAGKSALLEALQPGMEFKPHRSLVTAPEMNTPTRPISKSTKEFSLTVADMRSYLSRLQQIGVPYPTSDPNSSLVYFRDVLSRDGILSASWHDQNLATASIVPSLDAANVFQFRNADWPLGVELRDHVTTGGEPFALELARQVALDIYTFRAERYKMGSCAAGGARILASDASNLPEVLNKLGDDPATERELLDHVRTIFPHITHVSSALENGAYAHVRIWTHPVVSKRRDLAVTLADSGSGIGQVLAMLYVAVTAERPKVILIDEPQSFLHPGAVRKLFEILSSYSQHQYVITTAMPALGNLYRHGRGAAPDKAQAMRWYQQAAQRGYRDAAVALREL